MFASQGLAANACSNCTKPCEEACLLASLGEGQAVHIKNLMESAGKINQEKKADQENKADQEKKADQIDLSMDICGIKIENPFLLSSSVVASNYDMIAKAFDMGWAGMCCTWH